MQATLTIPLIGSLLIFIRIQSQRSLDWRPNLTWPLFIVSEEELNLTPNQAKSVNFPTLLNTLHLSHRGKTTVDQSWKGVWSTRSCPSVFQILPLSRLDQHGSGILRSAALAPVDVLLLNCIWCCAVANIRCNNKRKSSESLRTEDTVPTPNRCHSSLGLP